MKTETNLQMRKFGLIGRNISYSFSRSYFFEKFSREKIPATYENFDLQDISQFPKVLRDNPELEGLNVTIPYKEKIITFLDALDSVASEIGAVNTIKIEKSGKLTGYNTDHFGFSEAIKPFFKTQHSKALILGTGGASKAIAYALKSLGIEITFVSRKPSSRSIPYSQLDAELMTNHKVIVNCTPLGTSPNTSEHPPIPIEYITPEHLIFDLIYNPQVTELMKLAKLKGATVVNGRQMLEFQAEKAWEIWTKRNS